MELEEKNIEISKLSKIVENSNVKITWILNYFI